MDLTTVRTIRNLPENYHWYIISYINKNHVWTSPHLTDFLPPYCNVLYSNCYENLSQAHRPSNPCNQLSKNRQITYEKPTSDNSEEHHVLTENWSKRIPRGLQFDYILDKGPMFRFSLWGLDEFRRIMENKCVGIDSGKIATISDNGQENCQAQANRALPAKTTNIKRSFEYKGASEDDITEEIASLCGVPRSELRAAFRQWAITQHELEEIDDEVPEDAQEIDAEIELQSDIDSYLRNLSVPNLNRRDSETTDDSYPLSDSYCQSESDASEYNDSAADLTYLSQLSDNCSSSAKDWEESSCTDTNSTNNKSAACLESLERKLSAPVPDNRLSVNPRNSEESDWMDCGPSSSGHVAMSSYSFQSPSSHELAQTLVNPPSRDPKEESKISQFIRRTGNNIKRKFSKVRNPFKRNVVNRNVLF